MTKNTLKQLKTQPKPYQPLAWLSTAILLTAAALLSLFPNEMYATYVFGIAAMLWTVVGLLWKEKSLIVLNGTLTIIYVYGIVKHLYSIVG
jgi:hypothetical protein